MKQIAEHAEAFMGNKKVVAEVNKMNDVTTPLLKNWNQIFKSNDQGLRKHMVELIGVDAAEDAIESATEVFLDVIYKASQK